MDQCSTQQKMTYQLNCYYKNITLIKQAIKVDLINWLIAASAVLMKK